MQSHLTIAASTIKNSVEIQFLPQLSRIKFQQSQPQLINRNFNLSFFKLLPRIHKGSVLASRIFFLYSTKKPLYDDGVESKSWVTASAKICKNYAFSQIRCCPASAPVRLNGKQATAPIIPIHVESQLNKYEREAYSKTLVIDNRSSTVYV